MLRKKIMKNRKVSEKMYLNIPFVKYCLFMIAYLPFNCDDYCCMITVVHVRYLLFLYGRFY